MSITGTILHATHTDRQCRNTEEPNGLLTQESNLMKIGPEKS